MKTLSLLPLLFFATTVLAEPGWEAAAVHRKATQLLLAKDFNALEKLAVELKRKGYDIRQDDPEVGGFYGGFKLGERYNDSDWNNRLALIEAWRAAVPDSLSARIAVADWYIGHAWRARGGGWASSVTDDATKTMKEDIHEAAAVLKNIPPGITIDDPIYYDDWIKICELAGASEKQMFGFFDEGTAIAREYEPLYLHASVFLMERWEGKPLEREAWMTTWADSFPGEKGDILYAYLLSDETGYFERNTWRLPVDYERAARALEKRLGGNDPNRVRDQQCLCYLAIARNDSRRVKKMLLELEGMMDYSRYANGDDGQGYYTTARREYGVEKEFSDEIELERAGKIKEAERRMLEFTTNPEIYHPLECFYTRQGMEDKLMGMKINISGATIGQISEALAATAPPEYLAELASIYAALQKWDKAEEAARTFNQQRPMNLIGKNVLLLCAIKKGDRKMADDMLKEIGTFNTQRAIYQAAQEVVNGKKTWEQARNEEVLTKSDPYLSQGITSIVLYYMASGDKETARKVIEDSLPHCAENTGKVLLQCLDFGSLSGMLAAAPQPSPSPAK